MVIKHRPMMSLTTESCQAPLGAIFHDSRHGAVPGSSPRDVVKHTRQQVLADRVPSSIRIGGIFWQRVVEHGLVTAFPPRWRQAPLYNMLDDAVSSSTLFYDVLCPGLFPCALGA